MVEDEAGCEAVLVVDDDDAIRNLLSSVLRRKKLSVVTARDGEEALEKIADQTFGLILLDLMMPRLDGHAFLARLRESGACHPIILVISAGDEEDLRKVDRAMVTGIVRKPFDIFELASLVTDCLAHRAEGRAADSIGSPVTSSGPDLQIADLPPRDENDDPKGGSVRRFLKTLID